MPTRRPTIARAALEAIRERGPLAEDELTAILVDGGATKARDPVAAVLRAIDGDPLLARGGDGRWRSLADQLDGAWFSTPLTALERQKDVVVLRPGLDLVERLLGPSEWSADSGAIRLGRLRDVLDVDRWSGAWLDDDDSPWDRHGVALEELNDELLELVLEAGRRLGHRGEATIAELASAASMTPVARGPAGWLPAPELSPWISLRVDHGAVCAAAVERRDLDRRAVGLLGDELVSRWETAVAEADGAAPGSVRIDDLLLQVALDCPERLRTPAPPVGEVLTLVGLELIDGRVARPGVLDRRPRIRMLSDMRTTLVLDDGLVRRARARGLERGQTLSTVVNDALRVLLREEAIEAPSFSLVTYGRPGAGIEQEPADMAAVIEDEDLGGLR